MGIKKDPSYGGYVFTSHMFGHMNIVYELCGYS